MKTASKTMYTIGMVYAILFLVIGAGMIIIGSVLLVFGLSPELDDPAARAAYMTAGSIVLGIGVYFAAGQIVEIVMNNLGRNGSRGIQIANIVVGVVCSNVFTLLGGAFGLVSEEESPTIVG